MLTEEQIYANKMKFLELLGKLGIDLTDITIYLDDTDYWHKPASTQYFMAYSGGLCQYALNVCYELGCLCNAYFPGKYDEKTIIKVALFKDIYRSTLYETYNKNVKNEETGQWESQLAYRYSETRPVYGDLCFSSYMIARKFIDLTDEEIEAITQASTKDNYAGDIYEIYRDYPLVTLTKMADLAASYFDNK